MKPIYILLACCLLSGVVEAQTSSPNPDSSANDSNFVGSRGGNGASAERKAVNEPSKVDITGGGLRGLSAAGSAPTDFNFGREMIRVEDEPAHPAFQR